MLTVSRHPQNAIRAAASRRLERAIRHLHSVRSTSPSASRHLEGVWCPATNAEGATADVARSSQNDARSMPDAGRIPTSA